MKTVKVKREPAKRGTCGKRPSLKPTGATGYEYNPMAPPCTFKPKHTGPHSWENDTWRIS